MPKYKSETTRYGINDLEIELANCFRDIPGVIVQTNQAFCFICGASFPIINYKHPSGCACCGYYYNNPGQFCEPDIIIQIQDPLTELIKTGVVFLNGDPHDKAKRKKKDFFQIEALKGYNIISFTIWDEELSKLRHANRMFLCMGIICALYDRKVYDNAFAKEKELLH
jgi:hypothetical protein